MAQLSSWPGIPASCKDHSHIAALQLDGKCLIDDGGLTVMHVLLRVPFSGIGRFMFLKWNNSVILSIGPNGPMQCVLAWKSGLDSKDHSHIATLQLDGKCLTDDGGLTVMHVLHRVPFSGICLL